MLILIGLASATVLFIARAAATGAFSYACNKIEQKVIGEFIKTIKKKPKVTKGKVIYLPGKKRSP